MGIARAQHGAAAAKLSKLPHAASQGQFCMLWSQGENKTLGDFKVNKNDEQDNRVIDLVQESATICIPHLYGLSQQVHLECDIKNTPTIMTVSYHVLSYQLLGIRRPGRQKI
eukprot:1428497-Amphidinium_carterae.1